MICSKCQGRKTYRVGPRAQDEKNCSQCGGTGTQPLPGYLGVKDFKPDRVWPLYDAECKFIPLDLDAIELQNAIDRGDITFGRFDWPREPSPTSSVSPVKPPTLEQLLEGIDVVNHRLRDQHIDTLREAARRNVSLIPDHRIQDGDFTILVSPGDYARIKQEK